jgi:signal transduction histidine kinase
MPIHGLSIDSKLAGSQLTAMHQTLSHFLEIASQVTDQSLHGDDLGLPSNSFSRSDPSQQSEETIIPALLAVAESDPAILASLVSFYGHFAIPRSGWASSFSVSALNTIGMALATDRIAQYVSPRELEGIALNRTKTHMHGMLAQELALSLGTVDPVQAKVCAVLTGLPYLLRASQKKNESISLAESSEDFTASLLVSWGLPHPLSDVVKYQGKELAVLVDASELIRLVAVARCLIPYVSGPDLIDGQLLGALNKLIIIDEEALYGIVGRAGLNFDRQERLLEKNTLKDSSQLERPSPDSASIPSLRLMRLISDNALSGMFDDLLVSSSSAGTVVAETVLDDEALDTARFMFGFTSLCHFAPVPDATTSKSVTKLVGRIAHDSSSQPQNEPEEIEINTRSETSFIAATYRDEQVLSVSESELSAISELQISQRLGGMGFVCIPLSWDVGVLVCGLPSTISDKDNLNSPYVGQSLSSQSKLINGFVNTLKTRYRNRLISLRESERLEVDYVNRRVSEVTHEVNNPLAVVQNYLRTLSLKLDENAPVQSDIKTISEEILRVSKIVRKYSEIGRKDDLLTEEVNVNQVLARLLEVFRGGHEKIEIRKSLDSAMPMVSMSSDSFKQVIVNLVKNAIEAMEGQNHQLITIETHANVNFGGTSYIEVVLSDNGPGISEKVRERLFQPDNSSKSEGHSGLGLNIVKRLMEDMRGMVSCKSRTESEGEPGTTFQLLIPK